MTPRRQPRNAAASVHARLLTLARRHRWDFNLLLLRFTIERFLYRLSISDEVDRFTLKGATLFRVWDEQDARPTRDVDFLAFGPDDHAAIRLAVENVCRADCPADGVHFDPATIQLADIRQGQRLPRPAGPDQRQPRPDTPPPSGGHRLRRHDHPRA